jgi:membrane associated rhomboid family serine protease
MDNLNLASYLIFFVTILVSLVGIYSRGGFLNWGVLHPYSVVHHKKYYMIITSGFLHADMMHLMFNMLTFYFFAFQLETMIGSLNFFFLYFASLIISNISTIIKNKNNYTYRSVGASGAISGVLFSYILLNPSARIAIIFFPSGIPAPIFGVLYLAYCWWAAKKSEDFINHEAHFWGALAGVITTIFLIPDAIEFFLNSLKYMF